MHQTQLFHDFTQITASFESGINVREELFRKLFKASAYFLCSIVHMDASAEGASKKNTNINNLTSDKDVWRWFLDKHTPNNPQDRLQISGFPEISGKVWCLPFIRRRIFVHFASWCFVKLMSKGHFHVTLDMGWDKWNERISVIIV